MDAKRFVPGLVAALVLLAVGAFAQSEGTEGGQQPAADAGGKTGADPTDFITRYELSYEYRELESGADISSVVLRADIALRRDLSFRIDVPTFDFDAAPRERSRSGARALLRGLRSRRPRLFRDVDRVRLSRDESSTRRLGRAALRRAAFSSWEVESETGMGDIITQILWKPYSNDKMAAMLGLRVDWDTATEDELGRGGTTFAPIAAVAWYPNRRWILAPVVQWYLANDLDNDPLPGTRDLNMLSYRQIVLWQPLKPWMSWLMLDPELTVDFENDNETDLALGVEYGKVIGKKKNKAMFIKPTVGIDDHGTDWAIKIGFRHMFPRKVVFD